VYCYNLRVLQQYAETVWHAEKLMKESWEAETSVENRTSVEPVIIKFEEIWMTGQSCLNKWGKY